MRLATVLILRANHRVEPILDPERTQRGDNKSPMTTGGHSERAFSPQAPGESYDLLHRRDLGNELEIVILFPPHNRLDIHRKTEPLVQCRDDICRGPTAPFVEKLLGILAAKIRHRHRPSPKVQRHVVRQRAVAIKNITAKFAGRDFEFQKMAEWAVVEFVLRWN